MNKIKYENVDKDNFVNLTDKSIISDFKNKTKLKRNITKLLICGGGFKFFYFKFRFVGRKTKEGKLCYKTAKT